MNETFSGKNVSMNFEISPAKPQDQDERNQPGGRQPIPHSDTEARTEKDFLLVANGPNPTACAEGVNQDIDHSPACGVRQPEPILQIWKF